MRITTLALLAACGTSSAPGAGDSTGTPSLELALGSACSRDQDCQTRQCAFGVCRHDCKDWAECVGEMGTREHGCIVDPERRPGVDDRAGACTLDGPETDCQAPTDCPGDSVCDANGTCRQACGDVSDCLLEANEPVCAQGACYSASDRGWRRLDTAGDVLHAVDGSVSLTFEAPAITTSPVCSVAQYTDPLFEPDNLYGWPWAVRPWSPQCHDSVTDAALREEAFPTPVVVTLHEASVPLPAGLRPDEAGFCFGSQCVRATTEASGSLSARLTEGGRDLLPTLVESVDATVEGATLACAAYPWGDTVGDLSLNWYPEGVGQLNAGPCWPEAFEIRVDPKNITVGTYDLADPATWDDVDVSATFGGVRYGVKGDEGSFEGAAGTLTLVVQDTTYARLEGVTLRAESANDAVLIEHALLIQR